MRASSFLANAANKELARQHYRTETVTRRPDHLTEGVTGSIVGIAAAVRISKQRLRSDLLGVRYGRGPRLLGSRPRRGIK